MLAGFLALGAVMIRRRR
ncbi:hypothetical protein [Coraliomargarita algicola]